MWITIIIISEIQGQQMEGVLTMYFVLSMPIRKINSAIKRLIQGSCEWYLGHSVDHGKSRK